MDNLETTSLSLALYLKLPKILELRTDGAGWTSRSLCRPLSYVPPGFFFSSRWKQEIEWLTIHFDTTWLIKSGLLGKTTIDSITPHLGMRDDLLVQIIKSVREDALAGAPTGPTYAEALGVAAIHRLCLLESGRRPKEYAHSSLMGRAMEYIQSNCRDRLTLQMVLSR